MDKAAACLCHKGAGYDIMGSSSRCAAQPGRAHTICARRWPGSESTSSMRCRTHSLDLGGAAGLAAAGLAAPPPPLPAFLALALACAASTVSSRGRENSALMKVVRVAMRHSPPCTTHTFLIVHAWAQRHILLDLHTPAQHFHSVQRRSSQPTAILIHATVASGCPTMTPLDWYTGCSS